MVIGSDHGEAFGERGYEGHARNVYPEVTEVPLILGLPFRIEPGIAIEARSENVDLWPTLFDLLGLPLPEPSDGRSLVPWVESAARGSAPPDTPREAIAHLDMTWGQGGMKPVPNVAVTSGDFRLVTRAGPQPLEELFHHRDDPLEIHDVLARHPDRAEALRRRTAEYLAESPPWQDGTPTVELDEMELNQLRALGYMVP